MKIETINDWNRAAGCSHCPCAMPYGAPDQDYQTVQGIAWMYHGFINPDDGKRYLTKRIDYSVSGWQQWTWDKAYDADLVPTTNPHRVFNATESYTCADPYDGDPVTTYSGLVDEEAAFAEAIAAIIAWVEANITDYADWGLIHHGPGVFFDTGGGGPLANVYTTRYRWRIPHALSNQPFLGSYANVTWDVVRHDDSNPTGVLADEGLTFEWTGPGDQGDPYDSSWHSDWHDFNSYMIPPWDGSTSFADVNARWEYMQGSPLGKKPIPFGDAWPA